MNAPFLPSPFAEIIEIFFQSYDSTFLKPVSLETEIHDLRNSFLRKYVKFFVSCRFYCAKEIFILTVIKWNLEKFYFWESQKFLLIKFNAWLNPISVYWNCFGIRFLQHFNKPSILQAEQHFPIRNKSQHIVFQSKDWIFNIFAVQNIQWIEKFRILDAIFIWKKFHVNKINIPKAIFNRILSALYTPTLFKKFSNASRHNPTFTARLEIITPPPAKTQRHGDGGSLLVAEKK